MEKQFKYDAFISYRHSELDKYVAENLHRQLEAFRLPKSIAKKRQDDKTKIERVFRDKEELPLTSNLEDPIVEALKDSEWLIVICSPRLRESLWCKKEIETFVQLRGREHVLAVLIEGEPSESFPDELLYETKKQTLPDGTVEEVKIPVEPLAADVRGKNKKEMMKAMKTEILRLLAAVFQLSFDDLRQRHKERRMRRIVTASLIGGVACLLFGVYSTATALRIQSQKAQIEKQAQEILQQNEELALRQAHSLADLAEQYLEDGDRKSAIETATEALTESEGITLPYTPEAQFILAESLRVYDTGNVYKAAYQYETAGRIEYLEESPDSDTLVIYDDTQTLTLFDMETGAVIEVFGPEKYDYPGPQGCTFLGEERFAYINPEGEICIYDLNERKVVECLTPESAYGILSDEDGKYLAVNQFLGEYVVYDGETLEELGCTPKKETESYLGKKMLFTEGYFVYESSATDESGNEISTLYFVDLDTMQLVATYPMGRKTVKDIGIRDGVAYVASALYGEHYSSSDAYMSAIDITGGTLLWEYEQKGFWTNLVHLPQCEQANDLLFITESTVSLIDMKTGAVSSTLSLDSPVVEVGAYVDLANFLLLCENGDMLIISEKDGQKYDMSYKFECKTVSNDLILHSIYGLTVLERNDKKITVYTQSVGRDVAEIEEAYELPEDTTELAGDELVELAKSYGLDKPEYILSGFYSPDGKYFFARYWDYNFAIYDVEAGVVRNTIEDAYPSKWCLGTDSQGYTYLLGYYGCYMLDKEMKPVMWIPEAREIDMENRIVYMTWNDTYYQAPLYTVEELLTLAESYDAK